MEITAYCTYIFSLASILSKIVKLMKAEERAPIEDMKTRIAAHVPLLLWLT